jgi:hypothetical protein
MEMLFYIQKLFQWNMKDTVQLHKYNQSTDKILLEKLTVMHLVKKLPAFYGIRTFIILLTTARLLPLFSATERKYVRKIWNMWWGKIQ